MKRRSFFKLGLAGAALSIFKPTKAGELISNTVPDTVENPNFGGVVISTWEHGLAANDNAWKLGRGKYHQIHAAAAL